MRCAYGDVPAPLLCDSLLRMTQAKKPPMVISMLEQKGGHQTGMPGFEIKKP